MLFVHQRFCIFDAQHDIFAQQIERRCNVNCIHKVNVKEAKRQSRCISLVLCNIFASKMHHVTHDIFAPHVSLPAVRRLSSITCGPLGCIANRNGLSNSCTEGARLAKLNDSELYNLGCTSVVSLFSFANLREHFICWANIFLRCTKQRCIRHRVS